jgi:hypothetical protein
VSITRAIAALFAGGLTYGLLSRTAFGAYHVIGDAVVVAAVTVVTAIALLALGRASKAVG